MVIDANVYWLPDELFEDEQLRNAFLRCFPREYDVHASAYQKENGEYAIKIEKPQGCENLNYFQNDYKEEHQLSDMQKTGVDQAIMKLPGCQEWLSLELCRKINDAAYLKEKQSNGRFQALAVVPPYGDADAKKELERCIGELNMHGVQVSAHYGKHYLDHEMFHPFFQCVNDMKIPVYVHHTPLPVDSGSIMEYTNLRRSFGRCQDQITAIGRELFSGMFEKFPNVKLVHSMLGGGYFAFKEMLMPRGSGDGRFDTSQRDMVKKWLENHIYFELSHAQPWGRELLKTAVNILGEDHLIYGSSYPVKTEWMTEGPDYIKDLDITAEQKEKILYRNAKQIYGI